MSENLLKTLDEGKPDKKVRDSAKDSLNRESVSVFFHPTEHRLKRFIQFRHGHSAKGTGVVIHGTDTKTWKIPPKHRLFVVSHMSSTALADGNI